MTITAKTRELLDTIGVRILDEHDGLVQAGDDQAGTYGWAEAAAVNHAAGMARGAEYVRNDGGVDFGEAAYRFEVFHAAVSFVGYEDA